MKTLFISMTKSNIDKILEGVKTSTLRTESSAQKIGLDVGVSAYCIFKGKKFVIKNIGLLSVSEAGGKDAVWKSEGFLDDGPMFSSTKKWLEGEGKLYFYAITRVKSSEKSGL